MRDKSRYSIWFWASLAVVSGIALLVAVDLIEDPDSSLGDIALNLLEEAPLVIITVGVVMLHQGLLDQRRANRQIIQQLEVARIEGQHWRAQARTHLRGLGAAISAQFSLWRFTPAEHEVALLLLKGLSCREISTVRTTSERTVREQARAVYSKAGLSGRAALSAYFLEDLLAPADSTDDS
jgi:DNA-binding NarL/FixJ family response regulator